MYRLCVLIYLPLFAQYSSLFSDEFNNRCFTFGGLSVFLFFYFCGLVHGFWMFRPVGFTHVSYTDIRDVWGDVLEFDCQFVLLFAFIFIFPLVSASCFAFPFLPWSSKCSVSSLAYPCIRITLDIFVYSLFRGQFGFMCVDSLFTYS